MGFVYKRKAPEGLSYIGELRTPVLYQTELLRTYELGEDGAADTDSIRSPSLFGKAPN
mgnify:CR=1 FL=1